MQDGKMQDNSFQDDIYKMTVFKTVQFVKLQATNENTRDGKRTNFFKELPRPHKLPQSAPAESVEGEVKISKTCLPLVGSPCLPKILEEG